MPRLSIDIALFRERTDGIPPTIKSHFVELLFKLRAEKRINDALAIQIYGEKEAIILKSCFDTEGEYWSYPDVEKYLKTLPSRRLNAAKAAQSRVVNKADSDQSLIRVGSGSNQGLKKPTKKRTRKPPPATLLYTKCTEIYFEWFELSHAGMKPQFDGSDGKALKQVIKWLETNATEGHKPEDGLKYILQNWLKLDEFTKKKTRMRDINSNLNSIITQLKDDRPKKQTGEILSQDQWTDHFTSRDQATV